MADQEGKMYQALRNQNIDRTKNIFGILDFIKIPKFCGTYNPSIFSWMKQLNILLGRLDIPNDIEGAFIMTYLEGVALSVVQLELPLESFLPQKETVYKILIQNFGYKHAILSTIMDEHKRLGQIPSCQELSLEVKAFKDICLKHLQLLHAVEEIFPDMQLIPEEYILTIKHVLPGFVLRTTSFDNMDKKERFSLIKMNISQLKDTSRQWLIEMPLLKSEKQSRVNPVQKFKEVTCRICVIVSSNNCQILRPKLHRVTTAGNVIKESCPELLKFNKYQKIDILKNNNICRACLSLGVNTPLHPAEDCDYLEQKKLLFLKCPANGCKFRSIFCDQHQFYPHSNSVTVSPVSDHQCSTDTGIATNTCLPGTEAANVKFERSENASSMCPALHEDNHKLTIVKSPVEAMDSVNKVSREKGYNIEDKNVRILSSSKGEEELFDNWRILPQIFKLLLFMLWSFAGKFMKIKRRSNLTKNAPKRQEVMGFKILDNSDFNPG